MTPNNKYFFFSRRYSDPIVSERRGATKVEIYWVDSSITLNEKE
jgi:hypothetical protein